MPLTDAAKADIRKRGSAKKIQDLPRDESGEETEGSELNFDENIPEKQTSDERHSEQDINEIDLNKNTPYRDETKRSVLAPVCEADLDERDAHIGIALPHEHDQSPLASNSNTRNTDKHTRSAQSLEQVLNLADPKMDFLNCLKAYYAEDKFFKLVKKETVRYRNFIASDGLLFLNEHGRMLLCVPDAVIGKRNIRELVIL